MSKVTKSYNSYRDGASKWELILEKVNKSEYPISPKEIVKRTGINHSTVRVYLRRMLVQGEIKQPYLGYYCNIGRVGVPCGFGVRVHGLVLVAEAKFLRFGVKVETVRERVGGACFEVRFGRENGKVSCFVSCDPPGLDWTGFCFVMDRFSEIVYEKTGFRLREFETVNVEFNEDYLGVQLDGVKSVTVRGFFDSMERIYNKGNGLRSEVKFPPEKTSVDTVYALLKGGTTPYNLFQGQMMVVNEIQELREALKHTNEGLQRLVGIWEKMMEKR